MNPRHQAPPATTTLPSTGTDTTTTTTFGISTRKNLTRTNDHPQTLPHLRNNNTQRVTMRRMRQRKASPKEQEAKPLPRRLQTQSQRSTAASSHLLDMPRTTKTQRPVASRPRRPSESKQPTTTSPQIMQHQTTLQPITTHSEPTPHGSIGGWVKTRMNSLCSTQWQAIVCGSSETCFMITTRSDNGW
jgi:hypothetical protein